MLHRQYIRRRPHRPALHRQSLDFVVELAVGLIERTSLFQEPEVPVDGILYVGIEHLKLLHDFLTRVYLGILAKGGMEALQLDEGIAVEMNLLVALRRRIEHIVVDTIRHRTDTVYTTDALHQSGGVPWGIVIDDDVGTMQVDTLGKHIGSDDDVVIIALFGIVGVEALANHLLPGIAVAGANIQDVLTVQAVLQLLGEIVHRIDTLRENDQLA